MTFGITGISDDQAICVGYAGGKPEEHYLPKAHRLAYLAGQRMLKYDITTDSVDGKVIVTCDGMR